MGYHGRVVNENEVETTINGLELSDRERLLHELYWHANISVRLILIFTSITIRVWVRAENLSRMKDETGFAHCGKKPRRRMHCGSTGTNIECGKPKKHFAD